MTAEIAVLNKLAVTLAADSAVTIQNSDGAKVYNSAEKIFEATTYDPIGIMVYNSPELCGVPVESIVKMFRDHHCPGHFSTVFDFADAFLKHVENYETPDRTVKENIWSLSATKAYDIRELVRSHTEEFFRAATTEKFPSVDAAVEALESDILRVLDKEIDNLKNMKMPDWAKGLNEKKVTKHHGEAMNSMIDAIFDGDSATKERKDRIISILSWSLLKEFPFIPLTHVRNSAIKVA